MELKYQKQSKLLVCIYEMIGTAILIIMFNWSAETHDRIASYALTLFIVILLFGPVSGAHFNPAVTIAVLFQEGR